MTKTLKKNAHPKMGKLEARNALRSCHLGAWSTWQLGGLSGRTRPSHAYRRACRG
ncbi:hypothetical protein OM192_17685 [Escherichia albertii]|uniref:Uncharacterized protein n=1 Tax=Escherichia coli TaxID=562 RepID=A0A765T6P3_ECOLX|nr:hypothetical protein [Escherichia albertii]MCZ9267533.1 hypothetical protein [Escherichia albertii]